MTMPRSNKKRSTFRISDFTGWIIEKFYANHTTNFPDQAVKPRKYRWEGYREALMMVIEFGGASLSKRKFIAWSDEQLNSDLPRICRETIFIVAQRVQRRNPNNRLHVFALVGWLLEEMEKQSFNGQCDNDDRKTMWSRYKGLEHCLKFIMSNLKRKTVKVQDFKDWANRALSNDGYDVMFKEAVWMSCSQVLHSCACYNGYNHQYWIKHGWDQWICDGQPREYDRGIADKYTYGPKGRKAGEMDRIIY